MSRLEAIILRAASAWTVWIWGTRILNILKNPSHSTSFKAVHSALAVVSVIFAVAIWVIAGRNRRRVRRQGEISPAAEPPAPFEADRPV